jgi:putative endopeptidase
VIPAARALEGAFGALNDLAEDLVREIMGDAAATAEAGGGDGVEAKIGAVYASFMDTATIEARGLEPLREDLDLVDGATTRDELTAALGALQRTGAASAVGFWVDNDAKDPERYVVYLMQSGLGLPDESYYRDEQYASVLAAYRPHVARMLRLTGVAADEAAAEALAGSVVDLETKLAAHHWDVVKDRDADLTYNPMRLTELAERAPSFDWAAWVEALGAPQGALDHVVVREPSYAEGFAQLWASEPLDAWKAWLAYHVVSDRAPFLPDEVVEANFDFYGRTLTGAQELRDRWKRGVGLVQGVLGEAVGKVYVERHFPPSHKERMDELVAHHRAADRLSLPRPAWPGEDSPAQALAKLDAFTPKIGYPVRWRDYTALQVSADDLLGNVRRANAFEQDRELAKIGKPLDRDEWFMTPQTVNAYYNPGMNEIVFPAAILQPPFFDAEADDAANYGGIGAVIGHEIGHGFDDQGAKYDGDGNLVDWWTDADRTEFGSRTRALIEQYDTYTPRGLASGHHVNGAFTVGENIGDLGGLSSALLAYQLSLNGRPAAVIDGLTGVQRVFYGWAQVWRTKSRDAEAIRRLAVDPHSPPEFRCNGVLRNMDAFYDAFDGADAGALFLEPDSRVKIWN